jgi:hypothetical protein
VVRAGFVVLTGPFGAFTRPFGMLTHPFGVFPCPFGMLTRPFGILTPSYGILTPSYRILTPSYGNFSRSYEVPPPAAAISLKTTNFELYGKFLSTQSYEDRYFFQGLATQLLYKNNGQVRRRSWFA